jgi:adenine phosphoribosyltransferase
MTRASTSSRPVGTLADEIRRTIRDIRDFPKPGVVFKDITPLLADPILFRRVTAALAEPFASLAITHVVAIESRGFLLAAPVALALNAALVPARKPGKLPSRTTSIEYALEYGTDALEIHADACDRDAAVLIVDDVLATGGTAAAAGDLVRRTGATVAGYSFLMTLSFLSGENRLAGTRVHQLVRY